MNPPLPAAASPLLQPLLARAARPCPVVVASRTGVHVATGDPDVPLLSVVAPGGARLPGALVLAGPVRSGPRPDSGAQRSRPDLHRHHRLVDRDRLAGSPALDRFGAAGRLLVGDGTVRLDDMAVRVRRWWAPPAVRLPERPSALHDGAAALVIALEPAARTIPAVVAGAAGRLARAVGSGDARATARAVHAMVGLGPGLTPAADDVLVGALLCWHHLAAAGFGAAAATGGIVSTAVRERLDRTSAVSAALLHHAVRGSGVPEALLLLDALREPAAIASALDAVVRIGHDTGASIAYGVELAVSSVLAAVEPARVAR